MIRTVTFTAEHDALIRAAAAEIGATPEDFIAATFCTLAGRLAIVTPTGRRVQGMPRPDYSALEDRILRHLDDGPKARSDVGRRISNKPAAEIDAAIQRLIAAGRIRRDISKPGKPGRPTAVLTKIRDTQ